MDEHAQQDFAARRGQWKANGAGERTRRFSLVPFDKIVRTAGAAYLVRDLIPREGLIVIWGPPKCGKTFWTYDLAMHIALGCEYRGRKVTAGTVVYIACEGERGLTTRTEAYRQEHIGDRTERPKFYLVTTRLDLAGDHVVLIADIRAQLGDEKPSMIVIDTLNRSLAGSESSDVDMGAYIKAADAVREAFGCAVAIIHHCGIQDARPRGHTSLAGAADAQIAVKREDSGAIVAKVEFMKDGAEGAEIRSTLKVVDLGTDEDGEHVTSCVVEAAEDGSVQRAGPKKIGAAAKQAFDLLNDCMVDNATVAPASKHIPAGTLGASKTVWRGYCEKGGVVNPDGNPREQLKRLIVTLKDAGLIGVWDDFVWPVLGRHNRHKK